jgi:hypothetical protein
MTILTSPHKNLSSFTEGEVLTVDPLRFICSVKTTNGRTFTGVRWLLQSGGTSAVGIHSTPSIGDRVLVTTSLGYEVILGCIPSIDSPDISTQSITGGSNTPDVGTDSSFRGGITADPKKPTDFLPGELVYTAKGGAQLGILAGGMAILKASTLSQIVMSKFEGLVRLVTRNYQRYSDASSRVSTNMKGRLYEFFGADWNVLNNRNSNERYQEIYGDVAAGEILLGNPSNTSALPVADTRVRRITLEDINNNCLMSENLNQDGSWWQRTINPSRTTLSRSDTNSNLVETLSKSISYTGGFGTLCSGFSGSVYLTVGTSTGFSIGNTIIIVGGGAVGSNIQTTVLAITGNIFTLSSALTSTVYGSLAVTLGTTTVEDVYSLLTTTTGVSISYHIDTTLYSSTTPTTITTNPSSVTLNGSNILLSLTDTGSTATSSITIDKTQILANYNNVHAIAITSTGVAIT